MRICTALFYRFALLIFTPLFLYAQTTIITQPNRGRLGDQLSIVARALYFSYLYDLPLVVAPFEHSTLFHLSHMYPETLPEGADFNQTAAIEKCSEIDPHAPNTLYLVPYYVDNFIEGTKNHAISTPNFNDPVYRMLIKEALTPFEPIPIVHPPLDRISVAIHLRMGKKRKNVQVIKKFAYKFLGKHSALEMLKSLQKQQLQGAKLYVHIFTDHESPQKILTWFRKQHSNNIEWAISDGDQSGESVLSDLFSMASFDYLIRPSSNFSLFSLILGNHKQATIVTQAHWSKKKKETVADAFIHTTPEDFFRSYHVN